MLGRLPNACGVWGGGRGQNFLLTFWLGMVHFGVYSDKNNFKIKEKKLHLSDYSILIANKRLL